MTLGGRLQALVDAFSSGDELRIDAAIAEVRRVLHPLPEDPLLGKALLEVHRLVGGRLLEEEEAAALFPRAAIAGSHASALALAVDEQGRGHVVEVLVEVGAGERDVWSLPIGDRGEEDEPEDEERREDVAYQRLLRRSRRLEAERRRLSLESCRSAANTGARVGLALAPAGRQQVRWQVREDVELSGRSIGLAVAVATRAAVLGLTVPGDVAFTGEVSVEGRLRSVKHLPAKLRAARARGVARVVLPAEDRAGLTEEGLELVAVDSFELLWTLLFPPPPRLFSTRRLWQVLAATVALPILLGVTIVALPAQEMRLQWAIYTLAAGPLPARETAVVSLRTLRDDGPPSDNPIDARACFGGLVERLMALDARAVVFDFTLDSMADDRAFARATWVAAESAWDPRVPVVIVAERDDFTARPSFRAMRPAIRVGTDGLIPIDGRVAKVRLVRWDDKANAHFHLAVEAVSAGRRLPRVDGDTLLVDGRTIGTSRDEAWLVPVEDIPGTPDPEMHDAGIVATCSAGRVEMEETEKVGNRIVFVGGTAPGMDVHTLPDGTRRHGVEIHAGLAEQLFAEEIPVQKSGLILLELGVGWLALGGRRSLLGVAFAGILAGVVAAVAPLFWYPRIPLLVAIGGGFLLRPMVEWLTTASDRLLRRLPRGARGGRRRG